MLKNIFFSLTIFSSQSYAETYLEDNFDNDGINTNTVTGSGLTTQSNWSSSWTDDGDLTFKPAGTNPNRRALAFSNSSFQSDTGFKFTVQYTAGSIAASGNNHFSFGLISSDTALATYSGLNPFGQVDSVYSIGVNLTGLPSAAQQGLNFTNGTTTTTLDTAGTAASFTEGEPIEVIIEFGQDGVWNYSIDGVHEASGMLPEGFDLTKHYHAAFYAQDGTSGEKTIQSMKLERRLVAGERAEWMRGSWGLVWAAANSENGLVEGVRNELFMDQLSDIKTLNHIQLKLGNSYIYSPTHNAPHQVLESLWYDDSIDRGADGEPTQNLLTPRWVDADADGTADEDPFLSWLLAIRAAGYKTQVYVNSSNMLLRYSTDTDTYPTGRIPNPDEIPDVTQRWKDHCDANYAEFIASRDYHTATYDEVTRTYVNAEAEFPERKYVFCYAEYILKDYAIRYGDLIDAWIFDSGEFMTENGDENREGILEKQRLYEAFSLAARAGNPNVAVAFNNGPNRLEDNAANGTVTPFSQATHFDDYMFGHPYSGGSNIGKDKDDYLTGAYPTNYGRNYAHMLWMEETGGNVHTTRDLSNNDDEWEWDNQVVGHFFPPMSSTSWSGGDTAALEDEDFNLWNEKALRNSGSVTWGVSLVRDNLDNAYGAVLTAQDWALAQITQADQYLSTIENLDSPGAPRFLRAVTVLPDAVVGQMYYHTLEEDVDFWDPEGDNISLLSINATTADWLSITESTTEPGVWILSGTPTISGEITFDLQATDSNNNTASREVDLLVTVESNLPDNNSGSPMWASPLTLSEAYKYEPYEHYLYAGKDFSLSGTATETLSISNAPTWLSIEKLSTGIWRLFGTPSDEDEGVIPFNISVSQGGNTATTITTISVDNAQYLNMISRSVVDDAFWTQEAPFATPGEWTYNNNGNQGNNIAILYSEQTYQSDKGFRLTVNYTAQSLEETNKCNFAFGLVSADTDLANYTEQNPFALYTGAYSFGACLMPANFKAYGDSNIQSPQGLNFTDGSEVTNLHDSGTTTAFIAGESAELVLQVQDDGSYFYAINGSIIATGTFNSAGADDFDLSKDYHVVFFGQDNESGERSIQSMKIDLLDNDTTSGYDAWLENFTDFADNNANQYFDTDDISNLLEYVLGGNPLVNDVHILPFIEMENNDTMIKFDRLASSTDDTTQVLQLTTDMINWKTADEIPLTGDTIPDNVEITNSGSMDEITITIDPSYPVNGKVFGRLKVTR